MDLIKASSLLQPWRIPLSPLITITRTRNFSSPSSSSIQFSTFTYTPIKPLVIPHGKKKNSNSEPVIESTIIQEVPSDEEVEEDDEFEYEIDEDMDDVSDSDEDEDEYFDEEEDSVLPYAGDGGAGGGISLAGTWWDKKALAVAKEVTMSFDGDLQIYAFKTLANSTVQVRIEKLSNKSGSPTMEDIEAFSTTYRAKLDEAELAKFIPENLSLEVSSPGVERIVRIPDDLDRFKERPMYVKYITEDDSDNPSAEGDGVFKLESFDMETKYCTWSLANVRVNREKAGKGKPLNKKQREWRLSTPFSSLLFVRLHSDI
ncbi:uncharacterized protein LOC131622527 isoform X2 [Vicia villosa]|uniref:uncharacterized protein LOC131622527 isoform X2 n=1 Tax=Vicia villosa TaxID=3911 RepID=UPI00273B5ABC|nr:uncharacterized protein LOC131622527 isoform X2 [Vicia villosa]